MLTLFDGESDNPELIWESSMRTELRRVVGYLLDSCIEARHQSGQGNVSFAVDPSIRVRYKKLEEELFIGGVYVARFLKEPTYNIRDPTTFLEMLMQRWSHELQSSTNTDSGPITESTSTTLAIGGDEILQSVTNASVYICKVRPNLCDKLSHWGYMGRCLSFIDGALVKELYGTPLLSIMRILHVAVNSRSNVESLIMSGKNDRFHGIVPLTMRGIEAEGLHKDVAFMLEMMKKLFADALGDLKNVTTNNIAFQQGAYSMAPSPAPGEGPVSRNRVTRGNPLDDPLAVPSAPVAATIGNPHHQNITQPMMYQPPFAIQPNTPNPYGYSHAPTNVSHSPQTLTNAPSNMYGIPSTQAQDIGRQYNTPYQRHQNHQAYMGSTQSSHLQQSVSSPTPSLQDTRPPSWNQPFGYLHTPAAPQNIAHSNWTQGEQIQPSAQHQVMSGHLFTQQAQPAYLQPFQHAVRAPADVPFVHHHVSQQKYHPQTSQHHESYPMQVNQIHSPQQPRSAFIGTPTPEASSQGNHRQVYGQQHNHQSQNQVGVPQQPMYQSASFSSEGLPGNNQIAERAGNVAAMDTKKPADVAFANSAENDTPQLIHQAPPNFGNIPEVPNPVIPQPEFQTQRNDVVSIDARATMDPKAEAERRMKTIPGAHGAANGRVALLQCAISCDLPNFIIDTVLESIKLRDTKDPAAAKVHGIELLKLLTQDPGYGMKFQQILDENANWKKYKTQDHSLFITGPEQRADYFLTDGGNGEGKKLLTQG